MVNVTNACNDVIGSDVSNQRGDVGVVWYDISGGGFACDLVHSQGIGEENDEEEEQSPSKLCTFYSARLWDFPSISWLSWLVDFGQ